MESGNIVEEEWRPVVGYEGYYEVSNMGRVRSMTREVYTISKHGTESRRWVTGRILRSHIIGKWCLFVTLCARELGVQRNAHIHRMVAIAFVPNPNNLPIARAINGDYTDCRAENIEWATHKQIHDQHHSKKRREDTRQVA